MSDSQRFSCALITGASSGLGEEFALQLAPRADKLILVARREDRLQALATVIQEKFPQVAVEILPADLSSPSGCEALLQALATKNLRPDLLVNNAGLGDYGEFAGSDWSRTESMLQVNMLALTRLTHAIVNQMIESKRGAIINISSLASTLPMPDFAVYAATKAYVSSFSEALRIELKPHGIPVLAVCPGPVKTEFGLVASRLPNGEGIPTMQAMAVTKELVVSQSLTYLAKGKVRLYPGWKIAIAGSILNCLPLWIARILMSKRPRKPRNL